MDRGCLSSLARRGTLALVAAFALLCAPVLAADDTLLSGYSGPGGGEQVVIGSKVLPPKNGDGGLRASAPSSTPAQGGAQSSGGSGPKDHPSAGNGASGGSSSPSAPALAGKPTYPNHVSSASGLPLSRSDLVTLALVVAAIAGIAIFFTRFRIVQL